MNSFRYQIAYLWATVFREVCVMRVTLIHQKSFALLILGLMSFPCASSAFGEEYPLSAPLDGTFIVRERLVSDESEEVPPEPVPHSEYQPLDHMAPALVAEEILRLRDSLGHSPLHGRPGFRPLTLANESDENQAAPAPWEREDDRRDFRDRLRGMASRPVLPQPHGVPYGLSPYHLNPPAFVTQPAPHVYLQPQPVQIPYGYEPVPEGCHSPISVPSFMAAETQGQQQIDTLRQTAHQLEETAHQLECCEQFDRADQVRQLAELLRQDARRGRRAEDGTVLQKVRPAASEMAAHVLRAAVRPRYVGGTTDETASPRATAEAVDAEPSCPACPTLQKTRRGSAVDAIESITE